MQRSVVAIAPAKPKTKDRASVPECRHMYVASSLDAPTAGPFAAICVRVDVHWASLDPDLGADSVTSWPGSLPMFPETLSLTYLQPPLDFDHPGPHSWSRGCWIHLSEKHVSRSWIDIPQIFPPPATSYTYDGPLLSSGIHSRLR